MGKAELVEAICRDIREGKLKELTPVDFLKMFKTVMLEPGVCRCPQCGFVILFGGVMREEPYLFCMEGNCGWGVFARGDITTLDLKSVLGSDN